MRMISMGLSETSLPRIPMDNDDLSIQIAIWGYTLIYPNFKHKWTCTINTRRNHKTLPSLVCGSVTLKGTIYTTPPATRNSVGGYSY